MTAYIQVKAHVIGDADGKQWPCSYSLWDVCAASFNPDIQQYKDMISGLLREFENGFRFLANLRQN